MCLFTYILLDKEALVILVVQVVLVSVEGLEDLVALAVLVVLDDAEGFEDLVGKIVVGKTTTRTMAES